MMTTDKIGKLIATDGLDCLTNDQREKILKLIAEDLVLTFRSVSKAIDSVKRIVGFRNSFWNI